jgi:hypothetical protein
MCNTAKGRKYRRGLRTVKKWSAGGALPYVEMSAFTRYVECLPLRGSRVATPPSLPPNTRLESGIPAVFHDPMHDAYVATENEAIQLIIERIPEAVLTSWAGQSMRA